MFAELGKLFGSAASETVNGVLRGVDELFNRFKASPEQIAAWEIEKAKIQEQAAQRDANVLMKLSELDANDRNSARQREMSVGGNTASILAFTMVGGFLGMAFFQVVGLYISPAIAQHIPPEAWVMIGNISGYLAGEAKAVTSYYFGSSSGSASKQATIERLTK